MTAVRSSSYSSRRIVVGVDGSPPSVDALRCALSHAVATGIRVEVISCWEWPPSGCGFADVPLPDIDLSASATTAAQAAIDEAVVDVAGAEEVALELLVLQGDAASVLIEHAKGAELLVVASRGHGTLTGLLLGSVGLHCASHAPCPVLIVRGELTANGDRDVAKDGVAPGRRRRRIVVGVDSSPAGDQALSWALKEAVLTGARLEPIACWDLPALPFQPPLKGEALAEAARAHLHAAVHDAVSEVTGAQDVHIDPVVLKGYPPRLLVECSGGTDLLVMGSRGRGALSGVLLGSVGLHCATHALCSVVIVRHGDEGSRP